MGNENSAYDALATGEADMEQFFASPQLLPSVKKNLQVTTVPATSPLDIQLNTSIAPFDNILARKAVCYAVDQEGLSHVLSYGTGIVTQSSSGPGSVVYMPKVPGYRSYNLDKAKGLVQQLGGRSFTYDYGGGLGDGALLATALQADFKRAGKMINESTSTLSTTNRNNLYKQIFTSTSGSTSKTIVRARSSPARRSASGRPVAR